MKFNAKIFICGLGVCTLLASCKSSSNSGYEEATSVAKSTSNMPDWMRESDSLDDGQYNHVADSGIPKVTDSAVYTQESSSTARSSSAKSSSSKSSAKSSSKSSKSKATAKSKSSSSKKSTAKSSSRSKKPSTYVIQKGDTVEKIARKKGISVKSLMRANNMKNDRITAGKTLRIP